MTEVHTLDKRSRLARNSVYGLLSWVLPAIPSLIVTPIVVHRLGNVNYGLYIGTLGITSFFFTSGIGRISAKYIAEYRSKGDDQKASQFLSATLVVTLIPTLTALLCLAVAAPYLVSRVLLIAPDLQSIATQGLWIAGAVILTTALTQVWQSALQGLQRFDSFLWISNTMSLTGSAGLVILVIAGEGVLGLLIWAAISGFLTLIISIAVVRWVWPQGRLTFRIPRNEWRQVTVYAASVMGYQLFGVVILFFERGWIIREFGTESLTYYLVPMNVALLLPAFLGSLLSAIFPALNEHLADTAVITDLYRRSSKLVLIVIVFAAIAAVTAGPMFFKLWLGGDFAERSSSLLVIHTITFSVMSLSLIWWQMAESHRVAPVTAYANFGVMLITIPLMIILGNWAGLTGIATARVAGLLPYIALWLYVESRFAGGFSPSYWLGSLRILIVPAVLCYVVLWGCVTYLGKGWPTFVVAVSLGGIVYLGALFLIGAFDASEILMLKTFFARKPADAKL